MVISNNVCETLTAAGIFLDPGAVFTYDCVVSGNTVRDAATDGIYIDSGGMYTVTGNHVYSAGDNGIEIGATVEDSTISSNVVVTPTTDGIRINGSTRCQVVGNTVHNPTVNGIRLANSDYCVVVGNSCSESVTADGIKLDTGSIRNTISGNNCYNNNSDGIEVTDGTANIVSNNTCTANGARGIYFNNDEGACNGNICSSNVGNGISIPAGAIDNSVTGNTAFGNVPVVQINNLGTDNGLGISGTGNNCITYNTATAGGSIIG